MKPSHSTKNKKLSLSRDTVTLLGVRTNVQAGGYSLKGKLSAQSFCAGCNSFTVPAPQ